MSGKFATIYIVGFPFPTNKCTCALPQVTRKIIRKCVSMDGVEREHVSLEGSPQESISIADGDGYSKVVKRTVLKSEGDHTEVCIVLCTCVH